VFSIKLYTLYYLKQYTLAAFGHLHALLRLVSTKNLQYTLHTL